MRVRPFSRLVRDRVPSFAAWIILSALLLSPRGAAGFSIMPNGPSYVVVWSGTNAVLEHTTDLLQPFGSLDISSGLYFVTVPQPQEFFRLRLAQGSNQPPVAADDTIGTRHDTPLLSFSP
jgi:hypothetical protein